MSNITHICPSNEWPSWLKAHDVDCPTGLKFNDSGRLSELSHPKKQNIAYQYMKTEHGELLHLHNFRTGANINLRTYTPRKGSKDAQRIDGFLRGTSEETEARYARAAAKATELINNLPSATDEHPYLAQKGLPAFPDMKIDSGNLCIPVYNADKAITSIQFIAPDGKKQNLADGRIKGGRYVFPEQVSRKFKTVVISESIGSGGSINASTGFETICTFGTGNLETILAELRAQDARTPIIVAADNDCETPDNPGVKAAIKAAMKHGGIVAIPAPIDGKSTDFSDVFMKFGPEEVMRQISEAASKYSFAQMPDNFYPDHVKGSWKLFYGTEKSSHMLGDMLFVTALGRKKDSSSWMYFIEYHDRDGNHRTVTIPADKVTGDGTEWLSTLTSSGYHCIAGNKALLEKYITSCNPEKRIRIVTRTGWADTAFVTVTKIYNQPHEGEQYQLTSAAKGVTSQSGTLKGWQEKLGDLLPNNPLYQFTICVALSGPLLNFVPVGSGGFHFFGDSSCGKTTLLRLASSVWGSLQDMIRAWRTTDNGLEGVAEARNDLLLCLDEIHQADTTKVASIIYMLGNEMGKQRSTRTGQARAVSSWRLLFLSSGERSVEGKLKELGKEYTAGQEVRLASIPVKKEDVVDLHGFPDSGAFTQAIELYASEVYGTLGDAYLTRLTAEIETVREELPSKLQTYAETLLRPYPGCSSQVKRVALRFALCLCAGVYASHWELLPGSEMELQQSVQKAFELWLDERGGEASNEKIRVLRTVRSFIETHSASRFIPMVRDSEIELRVSNCVGLYDKISHEYIFYTEAFSTQVLAGYHVKQACKYLLEEGWLITSEKGKFANRRTYEGNRFSCYVIKLPSEDQEEPGPVETDNLNNGSDCDSGVSYAMDPSISEIDFS